MAVGYLTFFYKKKMIKFCWIIFQREFKLFILKPETREISSAFMSCNSLAEVNGTVKSEELIFI